MRKKLLLLGALGVFLLHTITVTDTVTPPLVWEKIPAKAEEYKVREFSLRDAQILMRIATAEAENQHCEGMYLVMTVVLNRVNSPNYPDTIEGVVFQDRQFSSVKNGRYNRVEIPQEAHEALARLEKGEPIDDDIIAFEVNDGSNSLLKYFDYKYTVGNHNFYVEKGGDNG